MNKININSMSDDVQEISNIIIAVSKQIEYIISKYGENCKTSYIERNILRHNIKEILFFWTGDNLIGCEKEPPLQNAFQQFFNSLYTFLLNDIIIRDFRNLIPANNALYKGILYRYLGHNSPIDMNKRIEPVFDSKWVSWSKNKENSYIENKLYGTITRIQCYTGERFGIDLTAFGILKNNEDEVVYPTIMELIDNIEYFSND